MPVYVNNGRVGREVAPLVEKPHLPAAGCATLPIDRVACRRIAAPGKALFRPQRIGCIAALLDEFSELAAGNGRPRHAKRRHKDVVRPFFIVENKRVFRPGAEAKRPARDVRVAIKPAGLRHPLRRHRPVGLKYGGRIGERLTGPGKGLVMHVFVKRRELVEITVALAGKAVIKPADQRIQYRRHVVFHLFQRIDRQVPPGIVGDGNRIVERIAAVEQRLMAVFLSQDEIFVKPGHMTDFPDRRVQNRQLGPDKLFIRKAFQQFQRPLAGTVQGGDKLFACYLCGHDSALGWRHED